jgi:hypothetical protein
MTDFVERDWIAAANWFIISLSYIRFMQRESRHRCFIYNGPPSHQLPVLAGMVKRKLGEGFRCMYLNSSPMVAGIRTSLAALGVDVTQEITRVRLVLSSETCTSDDGDFDIDAMLQKLDDAIARALADGYKGLWVTGDMTWEFGSEENLDKLIDYERQLEELFHKRPALQGVCQYHHDTLPPDVVRQGLLTHRTVFINETLSRINPRYLPPELADGPVASNAELDGEVAAICRLQMAPIIPASRV